MHIIVVGCGRVGSTIAPELIEAGHTVCVIDRKPTSFRRLGSQFAGDTLVGVGFDRDVLRAAGIERPGGVAVAAVTSGDNSNILIARVAREMFGVENVVARIYDPKRARIYERLGITTVASVAWTAARVTRKLLPESVQPTWTDPTASFQLIEQIVPKKAVGMRVDAVEELLGGRLVLIQRNGEMRMTDPAMLLQDGDRAHFLVPADTANQLTTMFDRAEGGH
ncbi:MAG TPA: TrkA family potassium uptake protein [Ilumatobacteraceae bacterium]|nr:TrkA family potassium uptake protein [Ilumatobacteraceae bacterium]